MSVLSLFVCTSVLIHTLLDLIISHNQGVQRRMVLVVIFSNFEIKCFCFAVSINDLVNDVEAIFLTANTIWKSFLKYE